MDIQKGESTLNIAEEVKQTKDLPKSPLLTNPKLPIIMVLAVSFVILRKKEKKCQ